MAEAAFASLRILWHIRECSQETNLCGGYHRLLPDSYHPKRAKIKDRHL